MVSMTSTQRKQQRGEAAPNPFTPPAEVPAEPRMSTDFPGTPFGRGDTITTIEEPAQSVPEVPGVGLWDVVAIDAPESARVVPVVVVPDPIVRAVDAAFTSNTAKLVATKGRDDKWVTDFIRFVRRAKSRFPDMSRISAVRVKMNGDPYVRITTYRAKPSATVHAETVA